MDILYANENHKLGKDHGFVEIKDVTRNGAYVISAMRSHVAQELSYSIDFREFQHRLQKSAGLSAKVLEAIEVVSPGVNLETHFQRSAVYLYDPKSKMVQLDSQPAYVGNIAKRAFEVSR